MQKMPKSSIMVLNIHQVVDIERRRLNSKDCCHHPSHISHKDGDISVLLSLEEEDETTSGSTAKASTSTSHHDYCSYSSPVEKMNPTKCQPSDSCTLSQCEKGIELDERSLEPSRSSDDDESLFSESQNSSAVFSFSDDDELCQDGVSVGDKSLHNDVNSTSRQEDSNHYHGNQAKEQGVKDKLLISFFGFLGALQRGACNVYCVCWTFVKRKSWTIFAILYEG